MLLPLCPPLLVVVEPLLAVLPAHHEGAAVGEVGGGGALAAVSQSANRSRNHEVVMFYADVWNVCHLSDTRWLVTALVHVFGISSLVGSAS